MKRIALLIATNFAVVLLLGLVIQVFGIDQWLARRGQNYQTLLVISVIFGFGGAFISLLMSKWMAKMAMGVQVIKQPSSEIEHWLVETVRQHAQQAGIGMPEVGVFQSPDPNAFATGASRNASLVAVSTGLLANMRRDEVRAVLGHEIAHVANGDMVTLTLIQGVLNTFVIFLARVIGGLVDSAMRGNDNRGVGMGYFITVMVTQMVLGLFASMIVAAYSRRREFRADAGGAELAGTRSMIGALEALRRAHTPSQMPESLKAFGINGEKPGALQQLFMSHPPLEKRIAALEQRTAALGQGH
ncbi:MAG TPA: protease HtpX [Steroidobacteraceae bacterium]|jgi:heat shock protein HtpX|nr:protease HtpX [Steroidobacteraceae bacterium]